MLEQVAKPHRGEGNSVLTEYGAHVVLPRQVELAQAVELLDPARKLFDAAVGIDRLGIAAMPGGATIDRWATPAGGVLRKVWSHAKPPHLGHELLGFVVLVAAVWLLVGT